MKKAIKLTMLVTTMILMFAITTYAENVADIAIEDTKVNFNRLHNNQPVGQPYIENNRTYLPIRVISEDLGYEVDWKQESQTAVIQKGKNKVEITIGQSVALVNGVKKPIDVQNGVVQDTKAVIKNSRTYVPVRFISEAMGDKVEYRTPSNSDVKVLTVYINCTNLPVEKPVTPKPTPPVVKPNPSGLVPEFVITPKRMSGSMDYRIYVSNFQKYKGTGATFSAHLVSHLQYNSWKAIDPVDGSLNVVKDENAIYSDYAPDYDSNIFNLRDWKVNSKKLDINTGKPQAPLKVGEIMKWEVTIKMNSGTEVWAFDVPYNNFNDRIITSGTRIK